MSIAVGCCGFPVSQKSYYGRFSTIELDSPFYTLPRLETARRWREQAPEGFQFALKAWQLITHPCSSPTYRKLSAKARKGIRPVFCGHFRDSDEVQEAWSRVRELAEALGARFILFQTPASFLPGADHLRNLYAFFKRARRGRAAFAWEARGAWEDRLLARVCADLGLVHAVDPLARRPQGMTRYFRLHGGAEGGRPHSDAELARLGDLCAGSAYVYFNNKTMWEDASRFANYVRLGRPVPR